MKTGRRNFIRVISCATFTNLIPGDKTAIAFKENEIVKDMRVLEVEEGDVIFVRCARKIPKDQIYRLQTRAMKIFPDNKVVMIDRDVEVGVIRSKTQ